MNAEASIWCTVSRIWDSLCSKDLTVSSLPYTAHKSEAFLNRDLNDKGIELLSQRVTEQKIPALDYGKSLVIEPVDTEERRSLMTLTYQ